MLVLTRLENQSIIIRVPGHPPITVTVLEIRPGTRKVRVGIAAPRDTTVHRDEIDAIVQREARQARAVDPPAAC
jgi:carbon storage regulator CsrA